MEALEPSNSDHYLTQEAFDSFRREIQARSDFGRALQIDLHDAISRVHENDFDHVACRGLVRAFGSFIDGLSRIMQEFAVSAGNLYGHPLNPYLQEKTAERSTSAYQRIYTSYRLVAEFVPRSPLARLPDARWDDLHRAIEIRNRIVHPTCLSDVQLTCEDTELVIAVGQAFLRDFASFIQWFQQKEQKLAWEHLIERRRLYRKVGRNEKCPCGSQRKYKVCCAVAQWAA